MGKILKTEDERLVLAKILALYRWLDEMPDDDLMVRKAKDAYRDLEEVLGRVLDIEVPDKHG